MESRIAIHFARRRWHRWIGQRVSPNGNFEGLLDKRCLVDLFALGQPSHECLTSEVTRQ
ncbi:MAG TPA: hypothetical protein VN790_08710 [Steroidobacteraceae bacterium]|nr:hypothetical protein [Steroidobacteraceae bacterium]